MNLAALTDFNLVVSHDGFGRAARAVDRPKATLSRRVAELEAQLGVRLFDRGARGLRLTDAGRELHERTHRALSEVTEAGESVSSGAAVPRGRLRISAPVVFAHVALVETAAKFARDHPLVQLEIVAEDRVVDLVEEQYDLVIRIAPSEDEPLVGRRITSDRQLLVAAPALARPPYRRSEDEQEVAAVLRSSARAPAGWRVRDAKGRLLRLKPRPVMRLSSLLMVRDAVIGGAGAALLPSLLVRSDVLSGCLVCWGVDENPPIDIWALQSSHRLIGAKVKAFLDALVEAQSPSTKA
jgi:DNA-binding transcriptional LysR family regulator